MRRLLTLLLTVQAGWLSSAAAAPLDYLIIKVNDDVNHLLHHDETLEVVRGDRIVVTDAVLKQGQAATVNLKGFRAAKPRGQNPVDDRHYSIDTAQDLLPQWSEGPNKDRYRIKVYSGGNVHGTAWLKVAPPELHYIVVDLNGQEQILRPKQLFHTQGSDTLKVKRVVTNVEHDQNSVTFEVVELKRQNYSGHFEIRFQRHGKVFATIPMLVDAL